MGFGNKVLVYLTKYCLLEKSEFYRETLFSNLSEWH